MSDIIILYSIRYKAPAFPPCSTAAATLFAKLLDVVSHGGEGKMSDTCMPAYKQAAAKNAFRLFRVLPLLLSKTAFH